MKKVSLRIISLMMAIICMVSMLPTSGIAAYAAVSGSDVASDSDITSDSDNAPGGDAASDSDIPSDTDVPSDTDAPVIVRQPENANIVCGQNAVFTIEAEGENLVYQWYLAGSDADHVLRDGLEFRGVNTPELTVVSMEKYYQEYPGTFRGEWSDISFSGDRYFCRVTNAEGSVDSDKAVFTANHNDDGEIGCDMKNHWCKCTCSLGKNVVPSRVAHTYTNGVCTKCGMSEDAPRLAGGSRCDTAALISSSAYDKAENVVIASGNDYADALAGVSLAYALDAPILLVRGSAGDAATVYEILRLEAKNIYILGGTVAVSQEYEDDFVRNGYNVTRIAGASRFETCVKIAEMLMELTGKPEEIFFAQAYNFPDALAISGIAAVKGSPVLYVSADGVLNEKVAEFVRKTDADQATVLGGELAIAEAVKDNIKECGVRRVQRLQGKSRYETNTIINMIYSDVMTGDAICVATGANYPDALAGGVLSAINKAPIVLAGSSIGESQANYLANRNTGRVFVLGGAVAVSDEIVDEIIELVR